MTAAATIPGSLDELTPAWLTDTLRAEGVLGDVRVVAVDCERLGGDGSGLIGTVARLTPTYDPPGSGPASLVAKLPTAVAKNRRIGEHGDYEREICFYREIAGELRVRTPRCYAVRFSEDATAEGRRELSRRSGQQFVLLLEDAAPARPGNDLAGCDFAQASAALRAAARLHASLWESPRLDDLWWAWPVTAGSKRGQQAFLEARPLLDEMFADALTPLHAGLLGWLGEHGADLRRRLRELPRTLLHVDFRLDNMLFSDETAEAEVTLIDWQAAGIGPAASDLAGFLGGSLREDVSEDDVGRLLEIYHAELVRFGVADYGPDALRRHLDLSTLLGFPTAVANLKVVDWGEGAGAARRDVTIRRKLRRLAAVRLADLEKEIA